MPLELGMFLGAKRYGSGHQEDKVCLLMDVEPYRYQKFLSDVAGQDIRSHGNDIEKLITIVRNWLRSSSKRTTIPGGKAIYSRYMQFRNELPEITAGIQTQRRRLDVQRLYARCFGVAEGKRLALARSDLADVTSAREKACRGMISGKRSGVGGAARSDAARGGGQSD